MVTGEGIKSVVRECYHLSYQVVNGWCALLINFMSTSNYTESRRNRIVRTDSKRVQEWTSLSRLTDRKKDFNSLQSVKKLLAMGDKSTVEEPQLEEPASVTKTPIVKKEYNGSSIPSKLAEKKTPAPKPQSRGITYFVFYPLFFLYPILVYCLWWVL